MRGIISTGVDSAENGERTRKRGRQASLHSATSALPCMHIVIFDLRPVKVYGCVSTRRTRGSYVTALCRDGAGQISRERVKHRLLSSRMSNYLGLKNTAPTSTGLSIAKAVSYRLIRTFVSPHEQSKTPPPFFPDKQLSRPQKYSANIHRPLYS